MHYNGTQNFSFTAAVVYDVRLTFQCLDWFQDIFLHMFGCLEHELIWFFHTIIGFIICVKCQSFASWLNMNSSQWKWEFPNINVPDIEQRGMVKMMAYCREVTLLGILNHASQNSLWKGINKHVIQRTQICTYDCAFINVTCIHKFLWQEWPKSMYHSF